jgi:alkylation response protein AidB-like acyl-CoA dehydrogenase
VDFTYTEEQLALQETLRRFIARDYDFERRRTFAGSTLGYSAEAWSQYAELGLLALPFPEEFDGLNGSAVDIMLVMELIGRGLLLEPFLSSVVLCGGLIRDAASEPIKRSVLPQIAAGKLKLALACYEAAGRYDLTHVACAARVSGGKDQADSGAAGWRLSGRKSVVLDAASADCFLVSARSSGDVAAADGISVFLVRRDAPGVTLFAYPTQSGGRAADLNLQDVIVGADALIGTAGRSLGMIERAVDLGLAALCAEAVGIIAALNEATLEHLKTRKQFGVPIGKFQALQHRMADMLIAAEQARSMAIIAAVYADSENVALRRRAVSGAKAYIGQAGRLVGQQAVQLHGAMGVVDDHIVSHYFKRLTMIDLSLGDADFHLGRFSDLLRPARDASPHPRYA